GPSVRRAPGCPPAPARKPRRFTSAMVPSVGVRGHDAEREHLQGELAVTRWSDQCQATTIMCGVLRGFPSAVGPALRGIGRAVRARPAVVGLVAAAVIAFDVLLPPLLLSVVRTPWAYFTINPWLRRPPAHLPSAQPPSAQPAV